MGPIWNLLLIGITCQYSEAELKLGEKFTFYNMFFNNKTIIIKKSFFEFEMIIFWFIKTFPKIVKKSN